MQGLKDLLCRMASGGVDFVLAGGFGAMAHGSSLVTRDVDIVCRMEPDNLLRLHEATEGLRPVHRMTPERVPFTRDQAEHGQLKNLYLSSDWGQLDCLGAIKGLGGYAECFARSEPLDLDGHKIRVLSLEALIVAKRAMGRPRDLHAVLELEAIRERLQK
ncbi:MAG: nucleotidyltransferase [Terrimicrobiaceae bacterium]|jgi:predicted nucleotidyltransferase|nr:nucleotidyltransferase [Terrimicrobiaceae bacterium]